MLYPLYVYVARHKGTRANATIELAMDTGRQDHNFGFGNIKEQTHVLLNNMKYEPVNSVDVTSCDYDVMTCK